MPARISCRLPRTWIMGLSSLMGEFLPQILFEDGSQ
jgi:hypothetical protein